MPEGPVRNSDGTWSFKGRTFRADDEAMANRVATKITSDEADKALKDYRIAVMTPEQKQHIKELLKFEEGILRQPTLVKGNPTLGHGRDLKTKPLKPFEREHLRIDQGRDWNREPLTNAEAEWLFEGDLNDAISQAQKLVGYEKYNELDNTRRAVLTSMAFQLGLEGVQGKFPSFLNAFRGGQYDEAALQMLYKDPHVDNPIPSDWSTQTGNRARRAAEMVRTGEWSSEVPWQPPTPRRSSTEGTGVGTVFSSVYTPGS